MIYVISDIHGCYEQYIAMLSKISFSNLDTMFILGDSVDRGLSSMDVILHMMSYKNIIPLMGNHDYLAFQVLSRIYADSEKGETFCQKADFRSLFSYWMMSGGQNTLEPFLELDRPLQKKVLQYFMTFSPYIELALNNQKYILVHGGLGNFRQDRPLDDYKLEELIFYKTDYTKEYFMDKIVITGHTPTFKIDERCRGIIYDKNNHLAIDCGAVYGEHLGAVCLNTGEYFYI